MLKKPSGAALVLLTVLATLVPAAAVGKRVRPLTGRWAGTEPTRATPLSLRLVKRQGGFVVTSLKVKVKEDCGDIARDASVSETGIRLRRTVIGAQRHPTWRFHRRVTHRPGATDYVLDIRGHFRSKGRAAVRLFLHETGSNEVSQPTPCSTGHLTFAVRHGG
jgi:hypothetical protein